MLGREIAINAFYASLGCFALTGEEEARQEAAIPPTSPPVLPSAPVTYHHGHRSGEYKKQGSQSLSASDHSPGFKYDVTSVQHLQTKLYPCTATHAGGTAAPYSCVSPYCLDWREKTDFQEITHKAPLLILPAPAPHHLQVLT